MKRIYASNISQARDTLLTTWRMVPFSSFNLCSDHNVLDYNLLIARGIRSPVRTPAYLRLNIGCFSSRYMTAMSVIANSSFQNSTRVSTSTNTQSTLPASYHPNPRPRPLPPFHRVDVNAIKQDLHDALGEDGLPYWKALNGYLLGQVGKDELSFMVKGWLKGKKCESHTVQSCRDLGTVELDHIHPFSFNLDVFFSNTPRSPPHFPLV